MDTMTEAQAYAATARGPLSHDGVDPRQVVLRGRPSLLMALPHAVVALVLAAVAWWLSSETAIITWLLAEVVQPLKLGWQPATIAWWMDAAAVVLVAGGVCFLLGRLAWLQSRRFELSLQQIVFVHGMLSRSCDLLELYRIRDVQVIMPLHLRIFGLGHCYLITSDPTTPVLPLLGVRHPDRLAQTIRDMYHRAMAMAGVVNVM